MSSSELLSTARLHLRVLDHTHIQGLHMLPGLHEVEFEALDYIAEHCHQQWLWDLGLEQWYVVPTVGAAPCEKRVTLLLSSLNYLKMELALKLKGPPFLAEPTQEASTAVWHASPAPQLFSAKFVSPETNTSPVELLTSAHYSRIMATTSPLFWEGRLRLDFTFPTPFFDARADLPKLVEPQ